MRSLLLGVDVSPRRMGWGLVDLVSGEPVACGCEVLWIEAPKSKREEIHWPDHRERTKRALDAIPDLGEVQAVYVEWPVSRFPGMAQDEGMAVGILQAEVQRRWPHAPVEYLKPSEWRLLAGLKGNASKADVMRAAEGARIDVLGLGFGALDLSTQDGCDALLIAVAGQRRNGENWTRAVERGDTEEAA